MGEDRLVASYFVSGDGLFVEVEVFGKTVGFGPLS